MDTILRTGTFFLDKRHRNKTKRNAYKHIAGLLPPEKNMNRKPNRILLDSSFQGITPFAGSVCTASLSLFDISRTHLGGTYLSEGTSVSLLVRLRPRAHQV
jgi:hypothetical protein